MTWLDRALGVAASILLLVAAWGLVRRRRWHASVFFTAYLLFGGAVGLLQALWPQRFYTGWFWLVKETFYFVLKLGIALEVAWRTFRGFPGAQSHVRLVALTVLGATALLVIAVPVPADSTGYDVYVKTVTELHPRVHNGVIWLMAVTLVLAQWYRVPVHPFHAGILVGQVLYTGFWSTSLSLASVYGLETTARWRLAFAVAHYLLVGWCLYISWRPESDEMVAQADILRRLRISTTA